jgi:hypothetical protein
VPGLLHVCGDQLGRDQFCGGLMMEDEASDNESTVGRWYVRLVAFGQQLTPLFTAPALSEQKGQMSCAVSFCAVSDAPLSEVNCAAVEWSARSMRCWALSGTGKKSLQSLHTVASTTGAATTIMRRENMNRAFRCMAAYSTLFTDAKQAGRIPSAAGVKVNIERFFDCKVPLMRSQECRQCYN